MLKVLRNPLFIYVLGFTVTFLIYSFNWSAIYPYLSAAMKVFFATTFMFYIGMGILVQRLRFIRLTLSRTKVQQIALGFYFLMIFYSFEFIVEGDIPLISKLLGRPSVGYLEFGVPLLHGVLISFNSFLIAHSFASYMSTKNQKILRYNLLLYLPALMFISRSIMVLGLLTSLFIYLHFVERVKLMNKIKLGILVLAGLFIFGVIGNFRSGGEYIYTQSQATEDFMESSIPKEFYWTYLYAASPLANFQNTVNRRYVDEYDFKGFIFYENLPQILSKNLGNSLNIEQRDLVRIVPWLTVGTTYGKSFSYLGWYGPYLLFLGNLFICLIIMLLLVPRNSSYHVTTISILSVIVFLNIFSNMLVVTGISFQLAYCVIFAFFEDRKIVFRT